MPVIREVEKYLRSSKEVNWVLDEEAIKKDEIFDGYYAIQTSEKNLKPQMLPLLVSHLCKIKNCSAKCAFSFFYLLINKEGS